jgi:hypothetical protein
MSVGDSFTLVPLSNFFVGKSVAPGPDTNLGLIQSIASGLIQNDAVNNIGGVTGNYTWYRLSQFGGNPGTQGVELREYLLVCRGVSTTANNASFQLAIPDGGFNPNYLTFVTLYTSIQATFPSAPGTNMWTITISGNSNVVQLSIFTTFNVNGESFFFYVIGI